MVVAFPAARRRVARRSLAALVLSLCWLGSGLLLPAQEAMAAGDASKPTGWEAGFEQAYARLAARAPYPASPLALRIVIAESRDRLSRMTSEEAAVFALALALDVERSLRFGSGAQEARGLLRLRLSLSALPGGAHFVRALELDSRGGGPWGSLKGGSGLRGSPQGGSRR